VYPSPSKARNLLSFRRVISLKDLTILLCIFTLVSLCSATVAVELNPDEFMPVDEVKPGMKGIGKTVFEGTRIDEFQVEVLDVVKNAVGPKGDIIWVLCSGGPLEETGVLSGMSGSPVYIDGRLIGAVAYRLGSFAKRPVAGVTPIASMLRILGNEELSAGPSSAGIPPSALHPVSDTDVCEFPNIGKSPYPPFQRGSKEAVSLYKGGGLEEFYKRGELEGFCEKEETEGFSSLHERRELEGFSSLYGKGELEDFSRLYERDELGSFSCLHPASSVQHPASSIQYPVSSIQYPVSSYPSMVPIQTPVMMAGFHPRAINDIAAVLKEFGMIPVQGGGTSSQIESEEVPLEPGAVLGMQLVRGDASAFGYGTVTYVDGDKVLAFGHAMVGIGKISLPVAGGRVGLLASSLMASSKYASPAKTIGTLIYDGYYGVMGVIGKQPEFIPLKVRVEHAGRMPALQEYNFEIAKHRLFSASYIFITAANVIYSAEKSLGDYTMRTHSEISVKGYPTISRDNIFSGTSPTTPAAAFAAPLYSIMQNRFEEADVESVLLEISFEDKRTNARIDGVQISKDRIRPGDSLEATVFLTPYMEDTVIERFEVSIPKDAPEGRSLLRISDAASSDSWESARAPMKSRIVDLSHLIRRIQEEESNNDIIVELFAPKVGVTIRDQELPALPLTAFSVMNSSKQSGGSGLTRGTTFLKQRIHTDYVISGTATLLLNIDRDAP
jgi:hypothetical protein